MAWIAVDAYNDEYIFQNKPKQLDGLWEDAIYEIVGWKYDIVKPSYKEIYSEISIKLQQLSDMALKLSIGFEI